MFSLIPKEQNDNCYLFNVNEDIFNIKDMFSLIPKEQNDNCYLFNVNEDIFNEWFIIGCFLLGIVVIIILLMANNSRLNEISLTHNVPNESDNRRYDLTGILVAQFLHNANSGQPRTYVNFPSDHPGHLNLERRNRFVSIIRSSSLADQYRFGSSLGNLYIKNTYRHPIITPEMIGVVLNAEASSN